MDPQSSLLVLVFSVDGQLFAIRATSVERVIRAIAVEPKDESGGAILGMVRVRGREVSAVDLREILGLPGRPLDPSQHFILIHVGQRTAAVLVDEVHSVKPVSPAQLSSAERMVPAFSQVQGLARLESGILFIEDIGSVFVAAMTGKT